MPFDEQMSLSNLRQMSGDFCESIRSDLNGIISCFEKEMKSLKREIEIVSPKKRPKGRGKKKSNDYTVNVEAFAVAKQNIFIKMKEYYREFEGKCTADFTKLKDEITGTMENCLTNAQLSIKVVEEEEEESSDSEDSIKEMKDVVFSKEVRFSRGRASRQLDHPLERPAASKCKKTDWKPLLSAVEDAPELSGVYEVKVWRAKKPAYIGHCDDLMKRLSLHKEKKPTGQKYLDQFISRNNMDIVVRYDTFSSAQAAKMEEKRRLKAFLEKNKNLPSYNYKL